VKLNDQNQSDQNEDLTLQIKNLKNILYDEKKNREVLKEIYETKIQMMENMI